MMYSFATVVGHGTSLSLTGGIFAILSIYQF
jgi:hypothetical protein